MMKPENDKVFTNPLFAKRIVDYFQPTGICYDPCRGFLKDKKGKDGGAFYNALPEPKFYSELEEGKDCLDFHEQVDWSITNPPWSAKAYRSVSGHLFSISQNVVLLTRLDVALGTYARLRDSISRGHGLKEIIVCKHEDAGFNPRGFILGVFHWQKNYTGDTKWTYWI